MKAKEPTSFTIVHKNSNDLSKKKNFEIVVAKLFMDYVKANPDFFQFDKKQLYQKQMNIENKLIHLLLNKTLLNSFTSLWMK